MNSSNQGGNKVAQSKASESSFASQISHEFTTVSNTHDSRRRTDKGHWDKGGKYFDELELPTAAPYDCKPTCIAAAFGVSKSNNDSKSGARAK